MVQPDQGSQVDKEFLTRLEDFGSAAVNLTEAWDRADHTGSYYASGYPFDKSFTDVVLDILHWKYVQQGQALGDEAPIIIMVFGTIGGSTDTWGSVRETNKTLGKDELIRVESQLIRDKVSFIGGGGISFIRLELPRS